jgi:hypothetical protein
VSVVYGPSISPLSAFLSSHQPYGLSTVRHQRRRYMGRLYSNVWLPCTRVRQHSPLFGLINMSTLRSASFSLTSSPALRRYGRTSLYRHMCGMHFGFGFGGLYFTICGQSGTALYFDAPRITSSTVSIVLLTPFAVILPLVLRKS